tara:strand:- start:547 stop:852 length:306 start_codon:yes stop_codon:yes gene_type:complete
MNGEKNKDLELQKFYDAEGNEITMLDNVDKEGISTEESVQQMFKKVQGDYSSLAGAPMSMKNMTLNQFKKEYTRNPNFRDAVGNSRYSKGLISAIKTDQGN